MTSLAQEIPFAPAYRAAYVEKQSRPSVAFRLILAIPHIILVCLGGLVVAILAIVGWFAALVMGRLPEPIARFIGQWVVYSSRIGAYLYLITDRYPPFNFAERNYPIDVELRPGRLNRLAVLFRIVLTIPVAILSSILGAGWYVCSFVIWLVVLITGRMPRPLFEASVANLRFQMRTTAFELMVTSSYPSGLFGDGPEPMTSIETGSPAPAEPPAPFEPPAPHEAAPPPPPIPAPEAGPQDSAPPPSGRLVLSDGARKLMILFIVLGILADGANALRFRTVSHVVSNRRAGDEFVVARRGLESRISTFQNTIQQCNSQPEPFRCAQDAERDLVAGLNAFDAAVDRIDFPDSVRSDVAALRTATRNFRRALEDLIAANSEEEYIRLAQALDTTGRAFDDAVNNLIGALAGFSPP